MPRRPEPTTEQYLPAESGRTIATLKQAIAKCEGCTLHAEATQAIFGSGSEGARIVIIGEQPGDREDRAGKPFVGQAGQLLDKCLSEAGIAPEETYRTNVVKHFKFKRRGKRRIHDKPTFYEMRACQPWLFAELEVLSPQAIVLLGATAAQSLLGKSFRVTKERGKKLETEWADTTIATIHPAAIIRIPDDEAKAAARDAFVDDLKQVITFLDNARP